jgi:pimeloyl-ACP methyl ester carboxylesterase
MSVQLFMPAISVLLRTIGRFWPRSAASLAGDLFLRTPPRVAAVPEAREAFAGAVHFELPFAGGQVRGVHLGSGPAVLLLHGWGGSSGQLHAFVAPLRAAGLSVVAFDAPGHAESTGTWLAIPQYAAAITRVEAHVGPLHGVLAHSMGCAAASFAMGTGLAVKKAVFIGPPADAHFYFRKWSRLLRLSERVSDLTKAEVERRVGVGFQRLDARSLAPHIHAPLLVIHDHDDREVPMSDGATIVSLAPRAHLLSTRGLGHRRVLRNASVVESAVEFLVSTPAVSLSVN